MVVWFKLTIQIIVLIAVLSTNHAQAEIVLDPFIQNGMVVQRGTDWLVTGTATNNESFSLSFADQTVNVKPASTVWSAKFNVPKVFSGPSELVIDKPHRSIKVNVGELWVCSGQSNMAFPLKLTQDSNRIVEQLKGKPISIYQATKTIEKTQPDANRWMPADANGNRDFSAVCLSFGAKLFEKLKAPIGLIDASLGGTWIESWISSTSFSQVPKNLISENRFKQRQTHKAKKINKKPDRRFGTDTPSELFDFMIKPLVSKPIKGVLWYQGEGNRSDADHYGRYLTLLMKDWRKSWGQPALPFVIVQLPKFGQPNARPNGNSQWAGIRDSQRLAVIDSQPAGLVVTLDLGDTDIHPKIKLPFGERAAEVANQLVYENKLLGTAPTVSNVAEDNGILRIDFKNGPQCIEQSTGFAESFLIAATDRKWQRAQAKIVGSSVQVFSEKVKKPYAVRYAWSDNPPIGMISCADKLPITPFRTDSWPLNPGPLHR